MIGLFLDHKLTIKDIVVYKFDQHFIVATYAHNVSQSNDYAFNFPQGNT